MSNTLNLNSPIYKLENYHQSNHTYIMREDLLPFSFGGNKVRIAIEFFDDMIRKGCECIITYGSKGSNLNRVIANMACSRGVPCYVIVAENTMPQHIDPISDRILKMLKATVIKCTKENVSETIEEVFKMCSDEGLKHYYVYGNSEGKGNEAIPIAAYYKAYQQIKDYEKSNGIQLDYIFLASGTGLTQAGLLCGMIEASRKKKIVGISVSRQREIGERIITHGVRRFFPNTEINFSELIHFEDRYICGGYGHYNDRIEEVRREMLVRYGIPFDRTYTGKALWGMNEYVRENRIEGKNLLFIHTGGTPLFFDDLRNPQEVIG